MFIFHIHIKNNKIHHNKNHHISIRILMYLLQYFVFGYSKMINFIFTHLARTNWFHTHFEVIIGNNFLAIKIP